MLLDSDMAESLLSNKFIMSHNIDHDDLEYDKDRIFLEEFEIWNIDSE